MEINNPAGYLAMMSSLTPTWQWFWTVIFSAAVVHGIYIAFLLASKSMRNHSRRFLAALCIAVSFQLANYLAFLTGFITLIPHFYGVVSPLLFLIGPLFYFFIRSETDPGFHFRIPNLVHFAPAILEIGLTMPIYMQPVEMKLRYIEALTKPHPSPTVGMILYSVIYLLHMAVYAGAALIRLRSSDPVRSSFKMAVSFYPAVLLMQILLTLSVIVFHWTGTALELGMTVILALSIHAIGYAVLGRSGVERGRQTGRKYKTSPLTSELIRSHSQSLLSLMDREKPFLQRNLTIADLAARLGLPSSYVSQILTQGLRMNFYELINSYRIREAQLRLADTHYMHYKIEAIGEEVGFRNKVSFIAAFKKQTRQTPSEYRKSVTTMNNA